MNTIYGTIGVAGGNNGEDLIVEVKSIIRNIAHEIGHSAGLPHVWEGNSPGDINQNRISFYRQQMDNGELDEDDGRKAIQKLIKDIRNNLLNSDGNSVYPTSDPAATELKQSQFQRMEKMIKNETNKEN